MVNKKRKLKKNNLSAKEIVSALNKHKEELKKYNVEKIGLFGSFLKKNQNKKSDIDLLVEFNKATFDNYMDLKLFLEKLFKRRVDLVVEKNLKPALRYVKKEAIYA